MGIQVKENVYWVGIQDWNLREFHGPTFHVPNGTTYNSYIILDDQITLIDLVDEHFYDEFMLKIEKIINGKEIKNLIINHTEPDHSGAFKKIIEKYPNIKVYISKKGAEFTNKQYDLNFENYNIVATGDRLNIGKNTLEFIDMKMLHWPDSMATYMGSEKILFSNDAFGQHIVSTKIFDESHNLDTSIYEAKRYYANIIMPMANILKRKLEEITRLNLEIDVIAPSHGIIWRKYVKEIFQKYFEWATWKTKDKVIIVYDTMWGNTEKMAFSLAKGFEKSSIQTKIYKASKSDVNEIMTDIVDAKAILVGSSTIYGGMIANIAYFLEEFRIMKPQEKVGFVFGSNGWNIGAVPRIQNILLEVGVELFESGKNINFLPTKENNLELEDLAIRLSNYIRNADELPREIKILICERCHSKELVKLRDLAYNDDYLLSVEYKCLFNCGSEKIFCSYKNETIQADNAVELWGILKSKHQEML